MTTGRLTFIDAGAQFASLDAPSDTSSSSTTKSPLRSLYENINTTLSQHSSDSNPQTNSNSTSDVTKGAKTMLIIDDIGTIEWIGYSSTEITRFARAVRSSCRKVSKSSITPTIPPERVRLTYSLSSPLSRKSTPLPFSPYPTKMAR